MESLPFDVAPLGDASRSIRHQSREEDWRKIKENAWENFSGPSHPTRTATGEEILATRDRSYR